MKKQFTLMLLLLCISTLTFAQQTLCGDNIQNKKYWVDLHEGSTYSWVIKGGNGIIISGQNTNELIISWDPGQTTASLRVTESGAPGCESSTATIEISFSGPSAELTTTASQTVCAPKQFDKLSANLKGTAPWSLTYSVNDEQFTAANITESPFQFGFNAKDYGTDYVVKLLSVSDKECDGTATGEVTYTVHPKITVSNIKFE